MESMISGCFISLENKGTAVKYTTLETVSNQRTLETLYDQSLLDATWAMPLSTDSLCSHIL